MLKSDESRYLKQDCRQPDKVKNTPNTNSSLKCRRGHTTTLDDWDTSSSDSESDTKTVNVCFTAIHGSDKNWKIGSKIGTRCN